MNILDYVPYLSLRSEYYAIAYLSIFHNINKYGSVALEITSLNGKGIEGMSKLEDFLTPLHQGVWEVIVLKEDVTEPLGKGWVKSGFNLPSPGTIASYRKGNYHCHETRMDYRVHMDLYDPAKNPAMHLVDDAPLLLMIGGTVESLWVDAKNIKKLDKKQLIKEHKRAWQLILLAGIALLAVGVVVIAVELGAADMVFAAFVCPDGSRYLSWALRCS